MLLLALAAGLFTTTAGPSFDRQIENVESFARLYGVVRYFYPSEAAANLDWDRFARHAVARVRPSSDDGELIDALYGLFGPLGPGIEIGRQLERRAPEPASDEALVAWRYVGAGIDVSGRSQIYQAQRGRFSGAGLRKEGAPRAGERVEFAVSPRLRARVAVALTQSQCRVDARLRSKLDALKRSLSELPGASADAGLDARLADVVVAWNVFRHFYPYWAEAGVDWEQRLAPQLRVSAAASTRDERRDALRLLVADARDGHGRVADTLDATQRAALPVRFDVVEEQIVVSASEEADSVPVGALVREIGGVASHVRLATEMRLVSGAEQWRRARALLDLAMGPKGEATLLAFDAGDGRREATLRYTERQPPLEQRPPELAQLPGDVLYVDLTRATTSLVTASLERLAAARGIVFDLRGYPTDGGKLILPHLLAESESDRWMHVAKLVGPFGSSAGWHGLGWDLEPRSPRFTGKIVFLTDGRAISYAESVMGYVRDRKLATIVGGPTAGTNGNVATFNLPGGFRVGFTGMRVTRHDGESPFHLLGVEPDIPAARTLSGLRAGRDEVLERGLAVIRQR